MLFLNISLPSISGHFRFDSGQCNSAATHIFSLHGFAPAFLRYSSPLQNCSSPCCSSPLQNCSSPCYSPAPQFNAMLCPCNSYPRLTLPLQFGALLFSAIAFPWLNVSALFPGISFPCFSTAFLCSALRSFSIPLPFGSALILSRSHLS